MTRARSPISECRWRVRFGPSLSLECDGEPFRLRTRQQLLLVARLATGGRDGLDRGEAAGLLWPEAKTADARTYLRRALMELRAAGIEVASGDDGLRVDPGAVGSDFEDAAASGVLGAEGEHLAPGWESPMLDDLRRRIKARAKASKVPKPVVAPPDADRAVLALLGESLLTHDPARAIALVAGHRYEFYTKAPEPDLLRFFHRLIAAAPEPSADRVAVMCVMAGISAIQTQYGAADALYVQAIRDAEAVGACALTARAHAMRCGMQVELRNWASAEASSERAIEEAGRCDDGPATAFAFAARAAYLWHTGRYDEAAAAYVTAIGRAEPGPHRDIARHNLAFVWGVLGGHLEEVPAMQDAVQYEGTHLPGGQSYERFGLGIGHGRFREAALGAAGALSFAADGGMERLVAIGLDNAGIAFAKLDLDGEAGACVRLGTRLRRLLEHPRSPMERDALRRHTSGRYFGADICEWEVKWIAPDPATTAYRVAARLRIAAGPWT